MNNRQIVEAALKVLKDHKPLPMSFGSLVVMTAVELQMDEKKYLQPSIEKIGNVLVSHPGLFDVEVRLVE